MALCNSYRRPKGFDWRLCGPRRNWKPQPIIFSSIAGVTPVARKLTGRASTPTADNHPLTDPSGAILTWTLNPDLSLPNLQICSAKQAWPTSVVMAFKTYIACRQSPSMRLKLKDHKSLFIRPSAHEFSTRRGTSESDSKRLTPVLTNAQSYLPGFLCLGFCRGWSTFAGISWNGI
jgi:hypothetical protein